LGYLELDMLCLPPSNPSTCYHKLTSKGFVLRSMSRRAFDWSTGYRVSEISL